MEDRYKGIGEEGLNRQASYDILNREQLKQMCNTMWKEVYGHNVIYDGDEKPDYGDGTWN